MPRYVPRKFLSSPNRMPHRTPSNDGAPHRMSHAGRVDCKSLVNFHARLKYPPSLVRAPGASGRHSPAGYISRVCAWGVGLKVHLCADIRVLRCGLFDLTARDLKICRERDASFTQDRAGTFKANSGPYEGYIYTHFCRQRFRVLVFLGMAYFSVGFFVAFDSCGFRSLIMPVELR
jgi:hypothetical protein